MWLDFTFLAAGGLFLPFLLFLLVKMSRQEFSDWSSSHSVKSAAIIIAHPDDEAMFFQPLLAELRSLKVRMTLLCLTNGNSALREQELARSCQHLGVSHFEVSQTLKDGMKEVWDQTEARSVIDPFLQRQKPSVVFTFDDRGVSEHINHISSCKLLVGRLSESPATPLYLLQTYPRWRKFLIPVHFVLLILESFSRKIQNRNNSAKNDVFNAFKFRLSHNWAAMRLHASQSVWFRRLFVLFSVYTFHNRFCKVN